MEKVESELKNGSHKIIPVENYSILVLQAIASMTSHRKEKKKEFYHKHEFFWFYSSYEKVCLKVILLQKDHYCQKV